MRIMMANDSAPAGFSRQFDALSTKDYFASEKLAIENSEMV
jgi:hypothetical protein